MVDLKMAKMPDVSGVAGRVNKTEFLIVLFSDLMALLETVVGLDHAESIISTVGESQGARLAELYASQMDAPPSVETAVAIVQDIVACCGGELRVVGWTETQLDLAFVKMPFGGGREFTQSLPMRMVAISVFGRIFAEQTGYARIMLPQVRHIPADAVPEIRISLTEAGRLRSYEREYFGATR